MKNHQSIIFLLVFLFTLDPITPSKPVQGRCKREIVESYNLNGYLSQRPVNMYVCPSLKASCCSMYDQFMMFTNWRDNIKKKLTKYYKAIGDKYKKMRQLVKEIFKQDFKKLVEHLHMPDKQKDKILQKHAFLKEKNLAALISRIRVLHLTNAKFMMRVRSTFYCSICDFPNHKYVNVPKKTIQISLASCGDIARNTINYSYFMNAELAKNMIELSKMLVHFSLTGGEKPVKIKHFNQIRKVVKQCANVFKLNGTNYKPCKKYCEHYKFNANSPVVEGYQVFFNEMINAMEKFLKLYTGDRRLEEKLVKNKKLPMERKLNDDFVNIEFNKDQLENVQDPYDEKAVDPNYDDFILNKMFNFQSNYEKDRRTGYVNFIKNKLHFIDVEYDFDNADENDIFKTNSHIIVDLENYQTKVGDEGVDISKHLFTNNINKSMKDMISHLKSRSKYKILYEKLDPTLLEQVNDISNDMVKHFHRDNFLLFKDFSLILKKEQIISNIDNVRKTSKKSGYNIK